MGRIVIACYRPKPGMNQKLAELTRTHVKVLRKEDLVTDVFGILTALDVGVREPRRGYRG